jgi:excisionase family DNA binding protein
MFYTLGQAATVTGKSKTTISRAIASGRISAHPQGNGSYQIDPAELHRVFPPVSANGNSDPAELRTETQNETNMLRRELEILHEERQREREQSRETIDDLRQRLNKADQERQEAQTKLTALITYQPPAPQIEPPAVPMVRPAVWVALALVATAAALWWFWWDK